MGMVTRTCDGSGVVVSVAKEREHGSCWAIIVHDDGDPNGVHETPLLRNAHELVSGVIYVRSERNKT